MINLSLLYHTGGCHGYTGQNNAVSKVNDYDLRLWIILFIEIAIYSTIIVENEFDKFSKSYELRNTTSRIHSINVHHQE